jgi:hypothetical protein
VLAEVLDDDLGLLGEVMGMQADKARNCAARLRPIVQPTECAARKRLRSEAAPT